MCLLVYFFSGALTTVAANSLSIPKSTSCYTVFPLSDLDTTNGILSGGITPLCQGSSTGVFTLSNYTGTINQWERQLNNSGWNSIGNWGATTYLEVPYAAGNWQYRAVVILNGSITYFYSQIITVNIVPYAGNLYLDSGNSIICNNTPTGTMMIFAVGTIFRWEKRVNSGAWISIANITNTYSEMPSSPGIWDYRVVIGNESCSTVYSNIYTIIVNPTLSISLGTNPVICQTNTLAFLPYTATTGTPVQWILVFDSAAHSAGFSDQQNNLSNSPNNIQVNVPYNVASGIYYATLSVITYYPACTSISYPVNILVNPLSLGGTVSSSQTICSGTSPAAIKISCQLQGLITKWQYSTNDITFTTIVGATATTLSSTQMGVLSSTRYYRAVGTSSSGFVYSNSVKITVNPITTLIRTSDVGTDAQSLCINSEITTINYATTGVSSAIIMGLPLGVIGAWSDNTITISGTPIVEGLFNYTIALNSSCGNVTASGSIVVFPLGIAGVSIVSNANNICAGNSVTFTANSTNPGTSPTYQWKVNGISVGTNDAFFTSSTLNDNDSVAVIMISNASPCLTNSPVTSNAIIISVTSPTANIISNNNPICHETDASFMITGTANAVITYTINGGIALTKTLTGGLDIVTIINATTLQILNLVSVAYNGCTTALGISSIVGFDSTTFNGVSWNNGLPTSNKAAIFLGNYIIEDDFYACSIQVSNNAVVLVNSTKNVYLNAAITVDSGSSFALNNNCNLFQTNANALNVGNISVKRNTSPIIRLDHTLWSSPVMGQNLYNFSPETLSHRFYTFNTNSNVYSSTTLNSSSKFTPAMGFAIRAPNNQSSTIPSEWTGTFMGVPNNGTYSVPLATYITNGNNYNLVGNPYPSPINTKQFLEENSQTIKGVVYFYQHTLTMNAAGLFPIGTNYASWTATGGTPATKSPGNNPASSLYPGKPKDIIQVGQGFFVKAIASGNVNFTNSMRISDQSNQFHKVIMPTEEKHRIWLNLVSDIGNDINQILVGYVAEATQDVDSKFDGLSYGNSGSFLYSVIDGDSYVIQGRALPFETTDEVSLGFNCTAAETYSIKLTDMDGLFLDNQDVFIRDNLTGTDNNIKVAPYTFFSEMGIFNNRFKIVYTQALGVPSTTFTQNAIIVYKNMDEFHISTKGIVMKDILVYDILGRVIYKLNDVNNTTTILKGLETNHQVALLKIISEDNQSVTVKVIN